MPSKPNNKIIRSKYVGAKLASPLIAIFFLTGCAQQTKNLSVSPPLTVPSADKPLPAVVIRSNPLITSNLVRKDVANGENNAQLLSDLAQNLTQHRLDKLPGNLVICTVNNVPITVADYRREFKIEQQQIQASLASNAQLADNLLQVAHQQNIPLTKKERETLLKSTGKMQIGGAKGFDKMLADSHMNRKQFTNQVLNMGLACKTANVLLENGLLNQLVNHLLLSQAAKENGFSKEAMTKYNNTIRSDEYKRMLATGAFSADDLRCEIINNELYSKETEKIKSESPLTDVELNDFYEKNRGKFRHGARIRLSQIFLALPHDTTKQKEEYQLAQGYLERARKGEDFAALANQYSQDPNKKKNDGGDVGFQEESKLGQDFAVKVTKLPTGTVVPEVLISPQGYHIFKVTVKESPGFYRLAEVKDQLKEVLSQQKSKQTVSDWLTNQLQKATIVISPDLHNLLAANKLERREDAVTLKRARPATQISGQGQHF